MNQEGFKTIPIYPSVKEKLEAYKKELRLVTFSDAIRKLLDGQNVLTTETINRMIQVEAKYTIKSHDELVNGLLDELEEAMEKQSKTDAP